VHRIFVTPYWRPKYRKSGGAWPRHSVGFARRAGGSRGVCVATARQCRRRRAGGLRQYDHWCRGHRRARGWGVRPRSGAGERRGFALHPDSTSLANLRDTVDQHRQAAIRQQSIDRAESEIRKLIAAKEWSAASEAARQATADFPDASTFARLRQDAETALKEQIEAAAKARAKQLEELLRKATELTKNEEYAGALEVIRNATLNDSETRPFRQLLDKAQAGLRQQEVDRENKARREEAIAAALRESTGLLAARSWTKASEVLDNATRTLGEDSRLSDFTARVQREQQEHQKNIQDILSEARFLCDSEEYDQAIDRLKKALAQTPNEPELERALAETQQRAPAFRKAARLSSIEAAAQSLLASGQWERAESILQEALRDLPGESALLALLNTAQGARQRNEGIQKCAKTVQVHLDADPERAKELLAEGLQKFSDSDILLGLRLPVVLGQAARRLELDTPKSALQVLEALGGRAKEPAVAALIAKSRQKIQEQEEELKQALSKAEALLQKGESQEALGILTDTPPELQDDSKLRTLRERAAGMSAALQKAADEIADVRKLLKSSGPEAAFKKIGQVSQAARSRPEFAALEEECRAELKKWQAATRAIDVESLHVAEQAAQAAPAAPAAPAAKTPKSKGAKPAAKQTPPAAEPAPTPEPKAAPPVQPAPPTRVAEAKKPLPWPLIIGGAVAAAAVVGVVIWMSGSSSTTTPPPPPSNASVRVDIHSDPQGATIHVGDQTCQTPNCSLTLSPGTYQVQAELKGFEPVTKPLTVASGKTADAVELSLSPVIVPPPPVDPSQATGTLVVQTGLDGALVYIDGAARDRTDASGKYTTTLDVATHRIQVEKTGYGKSAEQTVKIAKGQSVTRTFKLTAELARLDLRGAPAGVDVRVNGTLLGRTDGGAVFSRPVTPTAGDLSIQVTEGSASKQIFQRFTPGQTVSIEWVNIAPVNTQKLAEEKARIEAEQKKQAADEQARREAEQKKQAADEQARRDAEQKKQAADEQARREAEQKKQAADEQARRDAEKNKQITDNGAKEREAAAKLAADRKAILTTLKETETAYGARNMLQLSQFWPAFASSQSVVALFANKDVTKITMELRPKGDPQITGDTARITVDQIMTQTYKQGSAPPIPPATRTVNLVRKPQGWVIDSVK